eukprot:c22640_g1_i1 orf=157-1989(-)
MIQNTQRRKRQNCGNSIQGHHNTGFGTAGQIELGSNLTLAAEGNASHCSGPMFAGVHRGMNQCNRLNNRNLQSGGSEAGNSVFPGFSLIDARASTETCRNVVLPGSEEGTSQYSGSNSVGSFTNNVYPFVGDQSRNSYKRKSFMDSSAGSLTYRAASGRRESDFVRFTQGSGTRRSDTSMISVCDESQLTRESHDVYQCFRSNSMHHSEIERANRFTGLNTSWSRESYHSPSIAHNDRVLVAGLPCQAPMPRRMLTSEPMNESAGNMGVCLPETSSFRHGNGLSATDTWRANSTFLEEANNQSGFVETIRSFNSADGNQPRHNISEASNMIGISSVDSRPLQAPNRASRPAHFREFVPHASHNSHHLTPNPYVYGGTVDLQSPALSAAPPLSRFNNPHPQGGLLMFPPPGSAAALNSMMSGPQATFGDAYATMPGPAMTPVLPRFSDTSRASYVRQVSLRGPRVLPAEGINRHRFAASHELLNQSLVYSGVDWADIHDQHSNMRLDVDNMSYEELLALEERIGNVNTGLSEDNVDKCLKTCTHSCSDVTTSEVNSQESDVKCSICQEEYMEGDELGHLECGHNYHTACIKQWLLLKNQCPICKAAACSKA